MQRLSINHFCLRRLVGSRSVDENGIHLLPFGKVTQSNARGGRNFLMLWVITLSAFSLIA